MSSYVKLCIILQWQFVGIIYAILWLPFVTAVKVALGTMPHELVKFYIICNNYV